MTLGERLLKAFRKSLDTEDKRIIAEKLGFKSVGAVYKVLSGERQMDFETLVRFRDCTQCPIDWLLTEDGPESILEVSTLERGQVPIFFGPKEQQIINDLAKESNQSFQQQVRGMVLLELQRLGLVNQEEPSNLVFYGEPVRSIQLPLMGSIAAGEPIHIVSEPREVNVPDFMIKRGREHFVLHVRGDSMIDDQIPDGSLIICEARNHAEDGEKVVAILDGDKATVKRIYHEADRIRLQPANPLHKPIYVENGRQLDIQGVVVGIFHRPS